MKMQGKEHVPPIDDKRRTAQTNQQHTVLKKQDGIESANKHHNQRRTRNLRATSEAT
jgi:hypothetical protein